MQSMPKFIQVEEQDRTYVYPEGDSVSITGVTEISVSKSGNHRISAAENQKYIVAPGWRYIKFTAKNWSF